MLMTELVLLPIAHGYFVHICAWPLVHSRPAIHFGISFVLLHWLMGMVSCRVISSTYVLVTQGATYIYAFMSLESFVSRGSLTTSVVQGFLMATAGFLSISRSITASRYVSRLSLLYCPCCCGYSSSPTPLPVSCFS